MQLNECINFLLSKTQQKVSQHFKSKLLEFGITPVQYGVLHILWENDGLNSSKISNALRLDNSTITGIIDRLISVELVTRKEDPLDRRRSLVYLTQKGKELEAPLRTCVENLNEQILEKFEEQEKLLLKKLLNCLAACEFEAKHK
ncbi:MarR family winged helix-turn-helix transcriptional regulator [Anaerobacillus sp. MEB173]|uniref:MarR family winged helix-turn-helix transcriptional regulator n=1 Tax=Anaerobacillus sp. MEB173 TaxID=3383345 RepID=UPI003F9241CA